MSWIALALGLALIGLGLWGGVAAQDLLPTELGLLYAACGAISAAAGVVTVAIALLIRRVDALGLRLLDLRLADVPLDGRARRGSPPTSVELEEGAEQPAPEYETTLQGDAEPAAENPAQVPKLVGRYSAGGVEYSIFSDGSIEAQTSGGVRRFESMAELRKHLAPRGGDAGLGDAARSTI